jgi:tRNA (guanine37-N1)-methyltransferase
MAMVEAVVRLLPGVAGNEASLTDESFEQGLLEHAHYTVPREWDGRSTPDVLLSGDHRRIEEWRRNSAKTLTKQRRPDLYAAYSETPKFQPPETGDEHD